MAAWVDIDDQSLSSSSSNEEDEKEDHRVAIESVTRLDRMNVVTKQKATHIKQDVRYVKPVPSTIKYRVQKRIPPTKHSNDRSKIRQNVHNDLPRAKKMNEFVNTTRYPAASPNYKPHRKRPTIAMRDKAIVSVQSAPKRVKQQHIKLPIIPDQTDEKQNHKSNHINFIIKMAPVLEQYLLNNQINATETKNTRIPHQYPSKKSRNRARTNRNYHSHTSNKQSRSKHVHSQKKRKKKRNHNTYHSKESNSNSNQSYGRSKSYQYDYDYDYYDNNEYYEPHVSRRPNKAHSKRRQFSY